MIQRSFKCPKCNSKVILRGGQTANTMVVCNCGVWMDIYSDRDTTKLLNTEDKGISGEIAFYPKDQTTVADKPTTRENP